MYQRSLNYRATDSIEYGGDHKIRYHERGGGFEGVLSTVMVGEGEFHQWWRYNTVFTSKCIHGENYVRFVSVKRMQKNVSCAFKNFQQKNFKIYLS